MKLINADDLKEYAQKLLVGEPINTYFGINLYKMFEEIIDHAPAVEVPENNERLQGEWIEDKAHVYLNNGDCKEWTNFYCSVCDVPSLAPSNFCPDCGAEMQKGDVENDK